MLTLVSNELLKLRTIRTAWVLLVVQLLLVAVGVSGRAMQGFTANDPTAIRAMLGHAGVLSLFALILGVNAVAAEYRHKTITDTYLATPNRSRVIGAKLLAYSLVGLIFGIASAAVAFAATAVWCSVKDVPWDPGSSEVWRTLAGAVIWNALYAAISVSLGALIPNLAGATGVTLAWIAIVEGLLGQVLGTAGQWLPIASGMALGHMPVSNLLPQLAGGVVLAGYAILLAVLAVTTSVRRDVT